jgi:hypothetical protein
MDLSGIHKTQSTEAEAMAAIEKAGYFTLRMEVPPETNDNHWHDFDSIIFIVEGENVITLAETGQTLTCGPGTRLDFPRGVLHRENHKGFSALYGLSEDPALLVAPINRPPES